MVEPWSFMIVPKKFSHSILQFLSAKPSYLGPLNNFGLYYFFILELEISAHLRSERRLEVREFPGKIYSYVIYKTHRGCAVALVN